MAEERVQRKLTTILAADVVGYSRLMRADEEATLNTLSEYREVINGLIARHEGRVFSTGGDSVFAEFGSAVEAVRCAISCQEEISSRNTGLADDRKLVFRIGINVGDVMVSDGNLYGDGVNVAARLEGLADPGGICVSGSVFEQIKHKLSVGFDDMGPQQVKNIAEPVSTYRLVPGQVSVTTTVDPDLTPLRNRRLLTAVVAGVIIITAGALAVWWPWTPEIEPVRAEDMALPLPQGPSIAVLPFRYVGNDDSGAYLGSGIASDVSTDLTRFNEITVISSEATENFTGDIRQAAKEFGVQHVLHGEVQREGERLRISARLLDAISGKQVWAERYETEWTHIFDVRDEIAGSIASIIGSYESPLVADTLEDARRKETRSLTAYELVMLARAHRHRFNKEDNAKAHEFLNKAIELDPIYARAYVGLAWTHAQDIWNRWTPSREDSTQHALAAANKAIELDENFADAHWVLGDIYLNITGQPDKGIASIRRAIALNPNHPDILADYGGFVLPQFLGRAEEGLELVKRAMRLSPYYADWYDRALVSALFFAKRPQEAIEASESVDYPTPRNRIYLAASYGHLGQEEKARELADAIRKEIPDFSLSAFFVEQGTPSDMMAPEAIAYLREGIRKAGLPE